MTNHHLLIDLVVIVTVINFYLPEVSECSTSSMEENVEYVGIRGMLGPGSSTDYNITCFAFSIG